MPSSLASFKSRLVSPFWYRLNQVILENRPSNGCSSNSYTYRKRGRQTGVVVVVVVVVIDIVNWFHFFQLIEITLPQITMTERKHFQ